MRTFVDTLTPDAAVMYTCVTLSNVSCITLVIVLPAAGCTSLTPILPQAPRALPERTLGECAKNANARRVTAGSSFASLAELGHLTHLPVPEYSSHMASSFDRASEHAAPGDAAWFANRDFATLSAEQPELLLDVGGPGVVTRIWSANPSGVSRIYLDDAVEPTLEAPLLELLSGAFAPIDPAFAFLAAGGGNLYLPIAFQRRCRLTVTSSAKRLYYQVSYRRYAAGVQVEPSSLAALSGKDSWSALAARRLTAGTQPGMTQPGQHKTFKLSASDPGLNLTQPGGGVLRELRLRPSTRDPDALRRSLLRIWVDGEETVRAPLGDFLWQRPGPAADGCAAGARRPGARRAREPLAHAVPALAARGAREPRDRAAHRCRRSPGRSPTVHSRDTALLRPCPRTLHSALIQPAHRVAAREHVVVVHAHVRDGRVRMAVGHAVLVR